MGNVARRIVIYDTTLRDGAQGEGIHFSVKDKLLYVQRMAELGIPYVEAGWPGANPSDEEFFARAQHLALGKTKLTAFGSTCRIGEAPEESEILSHLLQSGASVITIFGKAWDLHVNDVLRGSLDENLRMIKESVAYLMSQGREVIFDAEHYFDGRKENPDYALACVEAAYAGGASAVVLCDTNGGALPEEVRQGVETVRQEFPGLTLGIHVHNDGGLAVANTLSAVDAGVTQVQGTWNGFGERCGNANLSTLIPWLQLKLGHRLLPEESLAEITFLSRYVAELANAKYDEKQPFVGRSAFAHKAGMHVDAILKNRRTFEHIEPSRVGNERRILISDQAGKANVWAKMRKYAPDIRKEDPLVEEAMLQIKDMENKGFLFETADGSLELLLLRTLGFFAAPFQMIDYHVWSDPLRGELDSVAVVKVRVGEEHVHIAAEGNGPVNALDQALRQALRPFFPALESSELIDYKVRVLDGSRGTQAVVRVIVETRRDTETWGTIGVSTNILKASAQALLDGLYLAIRRA